MRQCGKEWEMARKTKDEVGGSRWKAGTKSTSEITAYKLLEEFVKKEK